MAFVLAGGGNLGAIQVGQLQALAERGIVPDLIVGCSAGAMNGAGFAIDPSTAGAERLARVWREMLGKPDRLIPGSWLPSPVQLLRKGDSLSSGESLRMILEEFLGSVRRFDELSVPFECVATDVESNAEAWFSSGDLVQSIMASAALPSVYPMVTIGERRYLDGGVLNNVPVTRAVELGAREIYVLHMGLHGKPSRAIKRPLDVAMIAYWIARNGRLARDLAELPTNVEAFVLPVGERPDLKYNDFSKTDELIEQGYSNAVAYFAEQDRHREESATARSERLRSETRRAVDELRGKLASRRAEPKPERRFGGYAVIDGEEALDPLDERSEADASST